MQSATSHLWGFQNKTAAQLLRHARVEGQVDSGAEQWTQQRSTARGRPGHTPFVWFAGVKSHPAGVETMHGFIGSPCLSPGPLMELTDSRRCPELTRILGEVVFKVRAVAVCSSDLE